MLDPYEGKKQRVRDALDASDWQDLRAAAGEIVDLQPQDTADQAALDGWWTCHATIVAVLARHLDAESRI